MASIWQYQAYRESNDDRKASKITGITVFLVTITKWHLAGSSFEDKSWTSPLVRKTNKITKVQRAPYKRRYMEVPYIKYYSILVSTMKGFRNWKCPLFKMMKYDQAWHQQCQLQQWIHIEVFPHSWTVFEGLVWTICQHREDEDILPLPHIQYDK